MRSPPAQDQHGEAPAARHQLPAKRPHELVTRTAPSRISIHGSTGTTNDSAPSPACLFRPCRARGRFSSRRTRGRQLQQDRCHQPDGGHLVRSGRSHGSRAANASTPSSRRTRSPASVVGTVVVVRRVVMEQGESLDLRFAGEPHRVLRRAIAPVRASTRIPRGCTEHRGSADRRRCTTRTHRATPSANRRSACGGRSCTPPSVTVPLDAVPDGVSDVWG